MPNHTTCHLTAESSEILASILALVMVTPKKEKEDHEPEPFFDFNTLIPMPESLNIEEGTDSHIGYEALTGKVYPGGLRMGPCWLMGWPWLKEAGVIDHATLKAYVEKERPKALELGAKVKENIEKYGCTSWYEWSVKHWGTKWNSYDCMVLGDPGQPEVLKFETAWSPPIPVMIALSAKFPEAKLHLYYADEGGGFLGFSVFKGGAIESETNVDWDGEEGVALRKQLGVWYDPDEDDSDDDDEEAVEPDVEDAAGVEEEDKD